MKSRVIGYNTNNADMALEGFVVLLVWSIKIIVTGREENEVC